MKIKRGGFVCQVAYFWRKKGHIPDQTNLCSLFWRFLLNLIPVAILLSIVCCVLLVVWGLAYFFGFLFAQRPYLDAKKNEWEMVYFEHWPVVRGRRIYPIWLSAFCLGWLIRDYILELGGWTFIVLSSSNFWLAVGLLLLAVLAIILLVVVIVFLRLGFKKAIASETAQLCLGMIKAKKQRFCPIVEIVGGENEGGGDLATS